MKNFQYVPFSNWYIMALESASFILFSLIGMFYLKNSIKYPLYFQLLCYGTLFLCLIPDAYGHYLISLLPYIAILSAVGFFKVCVGKWRMIMILLFMVLFMLNIYVSLHQYPDFTFNKFGLEWEYSDSITRNMQEEISKIIINESTSEEIILLGWEPYICFRTQKTGCDKMYPEVRCNEYPDDKYCEIKSNVSTYLFFNKEGVDFSILKNSIIASTEFRLINGTEYELFIRKDQ